MGCARLPRRLGRELASERMKVAIDVANMLDTVDPHLSDLDGRCTAGSV
jgi:hypothetical protein